MKSLFERLRSRRLASTFILLATLSAAIVAGSFAAHGVRGQEKQNNSADATPLKVVNSTVPPNEFVKIAKQVGPGGGEYQHPDPAQAIGKQGPPQPSRRASSLSRRIPATTTRDNDQTSQAGRRATSRTSSTASSAARFPTRMAATRTAASGVARLGLHRRSQGLHHHQQPRHRKGRQDLREALHRPRQSG